MQTTLKVITIAYAISKTRFIVYARNRFTVLPMDAIPTKITAWIAYRIIANIHNNTLTKFQFVVFILP